VNMRKGLIALALVLALLAGAGAGSYKGGTYGTGTYAKSGATYAAGGAASGWDTVTVVLTMDPTIDFYRAEQDAAIAAASTAKNLGNGGGVFKLGVDDTTFAYAFVDTATTGTKGYWYNDANNDDRMKFIASGESNGVVGGSPSINWSLTRSTTADGIPGPRPMLLHFDPRVPTGATVVSAKLRAEFHTSSNGVWVTPDTMTATLMTNASDNLWYHYTSIYDGASYAASTDRAANMAKCNYNHQVYAAGATGNNGYAGTTLGKWNPTLKDRTYYYNWGSVTDWTGRAARAAGDSTIFDIDMTDCVQGIANGLTNNGIMIQPSKEDMWDHVMAMMQFEPRAGGKVNGGSTYAPNTLLSRHTPWIEIKYLTKKYQAPFPNGSTWAFVFQTDDGRIDANNAYVGVFKDSTATYPNGRPGRYTLYQSRNQVGIPGNAAAPQMLSWLDQGMEISPHGGNHYLTMPLIEKTPYATNDTVTMAASWDSLKVHMYQDWIDSLATANSRTDVLDSRRWGKSMAFPGNLWGPWSVFRGVQIGYSTLRVGDMGNDGAIASRGAAATDTARAGVDSRVGRMPRNVMLLPTTLPIESLVGGTAVTPTKAAVQANARRIINKIKAQNRGILSVYAHDFKSSTYNVAEVDSNEVRWILEVVDQEGGCYMTATEYGDWLRSGGVAVDTPAAYGQSDPFNFTAAQKVWYKPNGVDLRWLRNVR